jgi:uncharacterized protein (TIGR02147 family)
MRSPIETLKSEYLQRHSKNQSYSLRAFARLIGMPSGRLSQFFSGKRQLTLNTGTKISEALGFSTEERRKFLALIESQRALAKRIDDQTDQKFSRIKDRESIELSVAEELVVCDPIHFAIIALMETTDFRSERQWIAQRLGRTSIEIRDAITNLVAVKLVHESASGKLSLVKVKNGVVRTRSDVSSKALQNAHKKIMKEASSTLKEVNILMRDMSSMTIAIDVKNIQKAKLLIRDFRRKLAVMLEEGDQTEVYRLAIQLFPVSKLRSTSKELH